MNRTMTTVLQVLGIIVFAIACGAIMYFGLARPLGQGYIVGTNIKIQDWLRVYTNLVYAVTVFSLLTSLFWYVLARASFKVTNAKSVGKRSVWVALLLVNIVGVSALTFLMGAIPKGISLYAVHLVLFSLVGYYLATLLCTPAAYKYTPLGATVVRRKNR